MSFWSLRWCQGKCVCVCVCKPPDEFFGSDAISLESSRSCRKRSFFIPKDRKNHPVSSPTWKPIKLNECLLLAANWLQIKDGKPWRTFFFFIYHFPAEEGKICLWSTWGFPFMYIFIYMYTCTTRSASFSTGHQQRSVHELEYSVINFCTSEKTFNDSKFFSWIENL